MMFFPVLFLVRNFLEILLLPRRYFHPDNLNASFIITVLPTISIKNKMYCIHYTQLLSCKSTFDSIKWLSSLYIHGYLLFDVSGSHLTFSVGGGYKIYKNIQKMWTVCIVALNVSLFSDKYQFSNLSLKWIGIKGRFMHHYNIVIYKNDGAIRRKKV